MRFCRSLESDNTGLLRQGGLFQKRVLNVLHSLGVPSNKARSNLTGIKKEGGRKKFAVKKGKSQVLIATNKRKAWKLGLALWSETSNSGSVL